MGKQGPCNHCGTLSTPLWRNGPPEKPVLCNACGSRYRIRGSLANYAPKHTQGQPFAKRARIRSKLLFPKKANLRVQEEEDFFTDDNVCYSTDSSDNSTSIKSSSDDSAISYSQSCCNLEEEIQGEIQESFWKSYIPSRKRSRSLTSIERFQRDLFNILKYEEDHSNFTTTEDNLLIYNKNNLQISYNEIGLGSILLEENVAPMEAAVINETNSSLVDNKPSLLDVKVSAFSESQNRSSSMKSRVRNPNELSEWRCMPNDSSGGVWK